MSDNADARFAISDLVLTYAERIDLGDFEGLADLFTHAEVTAEGNDGVFRGRDAVLGMFTGATRRWAPEVRRCRLCCKRLCNSSYSAELRISHTVQMASR